MDGVKGDCLHATCDPVEFLLRVSMRSVSKAIFRRRSGSTCWSFIVAKCPRPMAGRGLESEWTGLRLCSLKAEMTLRYQCAAGATSAAFFLGEIIWRRFKRDNNKLLR